MEISILYSEFCGSDQLWIDFTDPEQQALKIAKLPPCLWHICLAIIPLGWLIVALPFFISDIRKKKRRPLSVSWSYIVKAFASLAQGSAQLVITDYQKNIFVKVGKCEFRLTKN